MTIRSSSIAARVMNFSTGLRTTSTETTCTRPDLAHRAYLSERQVAPLTGDLPSTAAARQIEGVAFLILSGWHIGYLPVTYAERWVESGRMRSILPEIYRLNTKFELVIRRGVTLTLVSQTFADILRETTRPFRR